MTPSPVPELPKPRNGDEAFRAGVRGAPFVVIDRLPVIPILVTYSPGPNIAAVERLHSWPPAREVRDVAEVYRVGRALRGVALLFDRWAEPPIAFMQTAQLLLNAGARHLRDHDPYGVDTVVRDYANILQSLPPQARHNESIATIAAYLSEFARKSRDWLEFDF